MRSLAIAVAGLTALASALPAASGADAAALQERQFRIAEPSTVLFPGNARPAAPKKDIKMPTLPKPSKNPGFHIGRRAALTHVEDLLLTFRELAAPYKHKNPPLNVYLILQNLAALLAAAGQPCDDIIYLGPIETSIQIATRDLQARQGDGIFKIGGSASCNVDDLISLLLTYASLNAIYGSDPPTSVRNLKEAIYAALKYCGTDPESGGIIPDKPKPGAPITPDKPTPGAPITPDKPPPRAPMTPEKPATGAPMTPEKPVEGAPATPDKPTTGAPLKPEEAAPGAPVQADKPTTGAPVTPAS